MSTPQPRFSVTLSADELASMRAFLDYAGGAPDALYAALDAAKPVRARATSTARPAGGYSPNTGDEALDRFMAARHDPKWKPKAPAMRGLPPLKTLKVSEIDAAEAAWKSACDEARAVVASGEPSEAEATLRDLIATHRNPWRLEATETARENGETVETRILTSPRHPGMAIHEIRRSGGVRGFVAGDARTWRVMAGGAVSEKVHYAARAAEIEADDLVLAFT